jgi:hypothetical protein
VRPRPATPVPMVQSLLPVASPRFRASLYVRWKKSFRGSHEDMRRASVKKGVCVCAGDPSSASLRAGSRPSGENAGRRDDGTEGALRIWNLRNAYCPARAGVMRSRLATFFFTSGFS